MDDSIRCFVPGNKARAAGAAILACSEITLFLGYLVVVSSLSLDWKDCSATKKHVNVRNFYWILSTSRICHHMCHHILSNMRYESWFLGWFSHAKTKTRFRSWWKFLASATTNCVCFGISFSCVRARCMWPFWLQIMLEHAGHWYYLTRPFFLIFCLLRPSIAVADLTISWIGLILL